MTFKDLFYQSERSQDGQPLYIWETQLHQTEANNDAVEDIPALLEVVVGIQSNQLQHHLSCKDPCEHLENTPKNTVRGGKSFLMLHVNYGSDGLYVI